MRLSHRVLSTSLVSAALALSVLAYPVASSAQIAVGVSITLAPPELPVYDQPPIPGPGYIWTPGYWAYGDDGYYWVPGTWVEPPTVGYLWTPGYWGWREGVYVWNAGYWGPHIGYYGGINYGFGYVGVGYAGGYWSGGVFSYNRTVNNFGSVNITNVYNKTVIVNNTTVTNVSYNGGTGGTTAKPTTQELAAAQDRHIGATQAQTQHQMTASTNRGMLASVNNGKPTIAATSKAGQFSGQGVIGAKSGGTFHAPSTATSNHPTLNNAAKFNTNAAGANTQGNNAAGMNSAGHNPVTNNAGANSGQNSHNTRTFDNTAIRQQGNLAHQGNGMGGAPRPPGPPKPPQGKGPPPGKKDRHG
jgi:hypothetical protein